MNLSVNVNVDAMPPRVCGKVGHAGGRGRRGRAVTHVAAIRGVADTDYVPAFVDGRHSDVADAGAHSEVSHLCCCYRQLSGQSLMALSLGIAQQHISTLSHISFHSRSELEVLAADRAAISAVERNDQRVRHVHLERLTNTINNLLALEHIMAVHVAASRDSAMDEASHTDDDDDA